MKSFKRFKNGIFSHVIFIKSTKVKDIYLHMYKNLHTYIFNKLLLLMLEEFDKNHNIVSTHLTAGGLDIFGNFP